MIYIDFETKSYADLRKVGAAAYADDPTTEVICLCWAVDEGEIDEWWPGQERDDYVLTALGGQMPRELYMGITLGQPVEAFNIGFEFSIWGSIMVQRFGWVEVLLHQWRDLMAVACYYALPAALDKLARTLGFPGKDPEGDRLITKYSKLHLKSAKTEIPEEDFFKFVCYCRVDVGLGRHISYELGDLPDDELKIFQRDLASNARGLFLDVKGIADATAVVEQRSDEVTADFVSKVGFKPTQTKVLKQWFHDQGYPVENLQKGYLTDALEEGLEMPGGEFKPVAGLPREAVLLRLEMAKASTKKLDAMSRQRARDGRAKFQFRYHGAVTGRPTGTGFQPLNLRRGFEKMDPEQLVRDIGYRDPKWLDLLYGSATEAVASASRYWIMAEPGNKIIAGDYVSVEAVLNACLAGEEWKVQAFRDGAKIYELMGDKIHKLPSGTVTKDTHPAERQDGKTGELAFGYQGALNAWLKFDNSGRHTDERIIEICKAWRAEHPMIVAQWKGYERAALKAMVSRDTEFYREIGFERVDDWLTMILPGGKRLWYYKPQVVQAMPHWHQPDQKDDCRTGDCNCQPVDKLKYLSYKNGALSWAYTYGGKLTENAVQAVARQLMEHAKETLADTGYDIILSVYDEAIAEVPEGFGSKSEFEEIMAEIPSWATGWPISADAWEGGRYRK